MRVPKGSLVITNIGRTYTYIVLSDSLIIVAKSSYSYLPAGGIHSITDNGTWDNIFNCYFIQSTVFDIGT